MISHLEKNNEVSGRTRLLTKRTSILESVMSIEGSQFWLQKVGGCVRGYYGSIDSFQQ